MVFAVRQLQENFQEENAKLLTTCVELTQLFDMVSRCPEQFTHMVCQFHQLESTGDLG
jgi:hypothetical protein